MTLTLLFGLLFLCMIGLLLIPIELYMNTIANQYYLRFRGLGTAIIEGDAEKLLRIRLKVFFRNVYFYPLGKTGNDKTQKIALDRVKKAKRSIGFQKIIRLMKSFTIKRMFVNIDTGDYLTNAKLYPLFTFLKYHGVDCNINFEGRNQMVLHIHNRPIHILKSFIHI